MILLIDTFKKQFMQIERRSELCIMERRARYLGGTAQVIIIHLFNGLEVNESFQLGLMLV